MSGCWKILDYLDRVLNCHKNQTRSCERIRMYHHHLWTSHKYLSWLIRTRHCLGWMSGCWRILGCLDRGLSCHKNRIPSCERIRMYRRSCCLHILIDRMFHGRLSHSCHCCSRTDYRSPSSITGCVRSERYFERKHSNKSEKAHVKAISPEHENVRCYHYRRKT